VGYFNTLSTTTLNET